MTIKNQIDAISKAHKSTPILSVNGTGIGRCSIYKWHSLLTEYTVSELPFPMLAIQTSGHAKIRRINDSRRLSDDYVMPRDMTIIPSNIELRWAVHGTVDVNVVIFEDESTCSHLDAMYQNTKTKTPGDMFVGSFTDSFIYSACEHLLVASSRPMPELKKYTNSLFYNLEMYILNYLGEARPTLKQSSLTSNHVNHALKRLEHGVKNKTYIENIAKELRVSPSYLSRIFKQEIGISPHIFLMSKRVKLAKNLLAETGLDIASIAVESGFSSQSHLTKYFTQYVELTPSKYREYARTGYKFKHK